MPPLERYLEHSDELAQNVANAWGAVFPTPLTPEFETVLEKACRYQTTKRIADNHREFKVLSDQEDAEEKAAKQAFAEAYRTFHEKHWA
jgi:hypothetical protein